jgi:phenylpropionate dioxygenase-like ring-hydroxylating dioxygenase large terminal subunit
MERRAELALIRRLLAHLDARTTDEASAPLALPAEHHTSPVHLERERRALFRGQPIAAALSADLPAVGSYRTLASGGVPLLLIRGRDGRVRAFLNVCRHRGAPLAEGCGTLEGGRLRCPFHAWTYDLEGRLAAIPLGEAGHRDPDADSLASRPPLASLPPRGSPRSPGLLERPCEEVHGLVLVRPEGDRPIEAEGWLGEVGADLDALGLRDFQLFD